jgi:GNAT superfamily N-acetyltransferase
MTMHLRIRPAAPGDGAGCGRVWLDLAQYYVGLDPDCYQIPSSDGLAEGFEQSIVDSDPSCVRLVAEADGQIVGLLVAVLKEPVEHAERELVRDLSRRRLSVELLGVAAAYRRTGAGSALMAAAQEWGLARGAEVVLLDTYVHSPTSVPFY